MGPLSVHSFQSWCPTLDDALNALPEHSDWRHDLYRALVDTYRTKPLRIVLWTEHDTPIGLIAFTAVSDSVWYPITEWLLPGFLGPVRSGRIEDVLQSVPLAAHATWWRMDSSLPPARGRIHSITRETTFGLPCEESFESHWRSTGIFKDIQRSRKRCRSFELGFDTPGAAEWVIRGSEKFWAEGPCDQIEHKLVVAQHLQAQGKLFTVSLSDGDRFVGGEVALVHRNDAVSYMTFRDRDQRYAKLGVGNYLLAEVFERARALGLSSVDIGGSFGYKTKWARPTDFKATLTLGPMLARLLLSGVRRLRSLGEPFNFVSSRSVAT